jgi:hypothetical protein
MLCSKTHDGSLPRCDACTHASATRAVLQRISLKTGRVHVIGCKSAIQARNMRVCPHRACAASSRRRVEAVGGLHGDVWRWRWDPLSCDLQPGVCFAQLTGW